MKRFPIVLMVGLLLTIPCLYPPTATASPDASAKTSAPASPKSSSSKTSKSDSIKKDVGPSKAEPKATEPQDPSAAVGHLKKAVEAAKSGKWWYFSALVLMLIMFLLKFIGAEERVGFWPKLGRWRYVISPALSLIAALLSAFQGGLSFEAAAAVFTTAYASSSLQELWEHGILGKDRSTVQSAVAEATAPKPTLETRPIVDPNDIPIEKEPEKAEE